ncbi:alpha/beta fold hydrolase [Frondihabitans sp. PAMC 28766]|uniref:alpha/beta fold hydrolase n=1 Tax=Frondihabitans sp. PAMC 28766 TaxID=1795630 RepID=UPI0009EA12D5|nr:alpha/beta fold hydrolase [Frondihabitans sp. PAMC 28766]
MGRSRVRLLVPVLLAVATLLAFGTAAGSAAAAPVTAAAQVRSFFVPVAESPGSAARIDLDVDLYTPAVTPAPAVLLAHGFGQTKADLAPEAKKLQAAGYVVLAYTARGFGRSGGSIGLDSLSGEVPDARALITVLAHDSTVEKTKGDPVVGVVGGSYGGALALMVGATDPRVDTVVAAITWNNLANALVPASAGTVAGSSADSQRDFKTGWASRLFGAGITPDKACGRFTAQFCALYENLIAGGQPTATDLALLKHSSPSTVLSGSHAPTLLLQGLHDNLFGLDQADANERQLKKAGAPVQVRWFNGGHDGGGIAGTDSIILSWLADHLKSQGSVAQTFSYSVPATATAFGQTITADRYPGLHGSGSSRSIALTGRTTAVVNPPGGQPASVTGLPGLDSGSATGRAATGLLGAANPAAEQAQFVSAPMKTPVILAGAATVHLRVTPAAGTKTQTPALLYAQLSATTGDAVRVLPGGVAPIRVLIPADGADVTVTLPATAWSFTPGDRLTLTVRTTDSQFAGSPTPAAYRVSVDGPLALPTVTAATTDRSAGRPSLGVLIGIGITLLAALALLAFALVRGRRSDRGGRGGRGASPATAEGPTPTAAEEAAPLEIRGLTKRFRSGFLAVDDVSFTVERGQVMGLLGENGAGKTTTLRMVAGLIRPDAGAASSFGSTISPGAPVLARLGCFIEGPGFLPHLSGRRNLELYWAATGRPTDEARFDDVLAVADLGAAITKAVRGYSQGMRQRLAIAQAMLGMPDLLVLDEPTNGLDPPQITALRGVLRRYAEGGRTVIVSSHLLGEVEMTCSHVVVMSHGRVVAAGPVGEIAGDSSELLVGVTNVDDALAALRRLGAESTAGRDAGTIRVTPGDHPVTVVVATLVDAGVGVTSVQRGRHLEEAFLSLIGASQQPSRTNETP